MAKDKFTVILLAAGKGTRMKTDKQKLYMDLMGKPVLCYSLDAFTESMVDEIILVANEEDQDYVRTEIVEAGGYQKVSRIIPGGSERFRSVYEGLLNVDREPGVTHYVLIHDSARAFITADKINYCIDTLREHQACVVGMPAKDTIRIIDEDGFAKKTIDRRVLWVVQTPQCFLLDEILEAFHQLMEAGDEDITDDVLVMERYGSRRVKMIEGGYDNIKITTPEDLLLGEAILNRRKHENR